MMRKEVVLIFGESKKGEFLKLFYINTLPDLSTLLGEPTETGIGIHMAIQSLLFHKEVLFIKIAEEGYSTDHYSLGIKEINKNPELIISAIALPGVGSSKILKEASLLAKKKNALLLLTEKDLYDLMTQSKL
jgi:hypothetical protein